MNSLSRATVVLLGSVLVSSFVSAAIAADPSPYAGQQIREVKALSQEDMDDLMKGRGMGLAKVGELNGYPGPAHILDLTSDLNLTSQQARSIAAIKERMSAAARPLGMEIIGRERELQRQFVAGTISESKLAGETEAIGQLQGRLRSIHLAAHIEAKRVLTPQQIARYNELRGYASADSTAMHGNMPGHHDMSGGQLHCHNAGADNPPRNAC